MSSKTEEAVLALKGCTTTHATALRKFELSDPTERWFEVWKQAAILWQMGKFDEAADIAFRALCMSPPTRVDGPGPSTGIQWDQQKLYATEAYKLGERLATYVLARIFRRCSSMPEFSASWRWKDHA